MYTKREVNECIDLLLDDGPRLIPVESIEAMRSTLLDFAEEDDEDEDGEDEENE